MNKKNKVVASPNRPANHTWWGQRWIEALEHGSRDVVVRLGKGRAYARDGRVHDLKITAGKVVALVNDDDLETYKVCLQLEVFNAQRWQRILKSMSQQALFTAQLLNGEMPTEIESVFHPSGSSLFPTSLHDMDVDCSCEDWSSPCKHVAATHYVLGDMLDHDPFLLFELRGLSREQVLSGMGRLRTGEASAPARAHEDQTAMQDAVELEGLSSDDFEHASFTLNTMSFNFDIPVASGALLHSLGKPKSWNIAETPQQLLGSLVTQASQLAIALATDVHPEKHLSRSLIREKSVTNSTTGSAESEQNLRVRSESDVVE
jgi:hypothetical protein